jgi:hypothetical protein
LITTCTKCSQLYEAGSEEQANEPVRLCARCTSLAELLDCADSLVLWRLKVDLISSTEAGPQLMVIIDRAEAAATKARAA